MENTIYFKHYDGIKYLIKNLGADEADDYLRSELSSFTKHVVSAREKVYFIKESINFQNNSDEKKHLEYDLDEATSHLNVFLDKLKNADEMYICYKEYLRKNSGQ